MTKYKQQIYFNLPDTAAYIVHLEYLAFVERSGKEDRLSICSVILLILFQVI